MATHQPCFAYDVFLSFRGEDTRFDFTDHLFTALKQARIRTFRDDDVMDRGKQLPSELKKAIHESAISVIVFSKSYASSKWCLDEVMMIIKEHEASSSKHAVIPVFYKVDPSDVRNQRGSFKEAFDAYDDEIEAETDLETKRELVEKVATWRDSLNKAATFTGREYKDGIGYESRFIINIVNNVIKKVDRKALQIEEKLVGIEDHVAVIENWLQDPSPGAVVLLIDGMGGIGKTTIAKYIYNSNFRKYEGSCFLADINKVTSNQTTAGLCRLQSQLLSTILKSEKEERIWNEHEGTVKVTNAICIKRVLLILDDVATLEQLDVLLGPKMFYPGSKVIITTRNKELSTAFGGHPKVYSVNTLSTMDAIELFSLYAFNEHQPTQSYIIQSEVFVRHCMGLPLTLRILGSSLGRMTIDKWEDEMQKLTKFPNTKIQEVLQISYDTLDDYTDKELFLHIACFFEGEQEDYIVKLLKECNLYPKAGIKKLMDRCLLDIDEYGRVVMHQLIKDMGREVVRNESRKDPGKRSRLWHHEDSSNVLQDHSGTKKVEAFMLDMQKMKEAQSTTPLRMNNPRKRMYEEYIGKRVHENYVDFKISALEKMKNLMLLQLNLVTFSGECKKLPRKLRLLRWHGCPLEAIPNECCLDKLVVLDMSQSKLKYVWVGSKFVGSLKILNLSHSVDLIKTPDFDGLPGLERLILKGCSSLIKVHDSFSYLEELVVLDITDCRSLLHLPSLPRSLVSIQMSGCPNLGVLGRVQSFYSTPSFSLLNHANFSYCNLSDDSFPNDMSSLVSLLSLNIGGNNVTSLPECILTLPRVGFLYLENCPQLRSVLGWKKSTCELLIGYNESLERLELPRRCKLANYHWHCPKLFEMEGRYMLRTRESDTSEGMELGLKVLHKYGIFSTFVSEKETPSHFRYKARGPKISFEVPWHPNSLPTSGFYMCVVLSQSRRWPSPFFYTFLMLRVHNKTKDFLWMYTTRTKHHKVTEYISWLSLWRCGNLLEAGDEIVISIDQTPEVVVEECHVNFIYEGSEQLDDERNEGHHVIVFDQILWADRMHEAISNCADSGGWHHFQTRGSIEWV